MRKKHKYETDNIILKNIVKIIKKNLIKETVQ